MKAQTLTANFSQTICWQDDTIVDWAGGHVYFLDGKVKQLDCHYSFRFDGAVTSPDGNYAFIYTKLGTKGLLLKNGVLIREINRSYYIADAYEYPVAFITSGSKTYLAHCPISYKQLDFEDVETGEIITNIEGRKPDDQFHSRLEVSPDGTFLMSKGWVWHPRDIISVINIQECIRNPLLLDDPKCLRNVYAEICTASFIDDHTIVIGSSDEEFGDEDVVSLLPPKHICLCDVRTYELSKPVKVRGDFGNLFAINANYAWDLYKFPKIIAIKTGEIIAENKEFNSGEQRSSLIGLSENYPSIIFNRQTKQVAIKGNERITVLTPDL